MPARTAGSYTKPIGGRPASEDRCPPRFRHRYRDRVFDWGFLYDSPGAAYDQEEGEFCSSVGSGTIVSAPTTRGTALQYPGGTGTGTHDPASTRTLTAGFTISLIIESNASPAWVIGGNSSNNKYAFFVTPTTIYSRPNTSTWTTATTPATVVGVPEHYIYTRDSLNNGRFYYNGKDVGTATNTNISGTCDVDTVTGYAGSRAFQVNGKVIQFVGWDRCLPAQEIDLMFADPFGHYRVEAEKSISLAPSVVSVSLHNLALLGVGT
jgi:hypothetical protein